MVRSKNYPFIQNFSQGFLCPLRKGVIQRVLQLPPHLHYIFIKSYRCLLGCVWKRVVCQLSRTLVQYLICYLTTCNGRSPRLHSIFISSLGTLPQHYFSVKANIYFDTDDLFLSELQKAQMQFSFLSLCFFTPTTCTEVHFIIIAVCGNYSKKLKQTNDM